MQIFRPLAVCASARVDGNTTQALHHFFGTQLQEVHLCQMNLTPYDYAYRNKDDDFLPLMRTLVDHDPIILATPVYWYTMSASLKIFFDRMTDLMYHHKDLLAQTKGKRVAVVVSTSHPKPEEFANPIIATCQYLDWSYQGCWDQIFPLEQFADHNQAQTALAQAWWDKVSSDSVATTS
jgi:multimeric flavodoxin WrbA